MNQAYVAAKSLMIIIGMLSWL